MNLTIEEYVKKGDNEYDCDNFVNAIKFYNKAIKLGLNDRLAYKKLAKSYESLKKYDLAINCYRKQIELSNNQEFISNYYESIGNCYFELEQYDLAIENLNNALDYWINKGFDENYFKDDALTIEDYLDPLYTKLGDCYLKQNEYELAIKNYSNAIKYGNKYCYSDLGFCYYILDNFDMAICIFNKAVEIEPNNYLPHEYIGLSLYHQNKYILALESMSKSIELCNIDEVIPYLYFFKGNIYKSCGNYTLAVNNYEFALKLDPNNNDFKDCLNNIKNEKLDTEDKLKKSSQQKYRYGRRVDL